MPLTLQIEITTKRNLHCPRCERSTLDKSMLNKDMSIETFKKIAPIFPHVGLVRLFCYGEPFMHPQFMRILEIAQKRGASVEFPTNGVLLNENIIKKLVELKIYEITFSVDGATAKTFEKIRPGAKFKKVISNIKKIDAVKKMFKSKYPRVTICFTITKENIKEMPKMIDLASKLHVEEVWFQSVIAFEELGKKSTIYDLSLKEIERIFRETEKRAKMRRIEIRLPKIRQSYGSRPICMFPWNYMFIRRDGLVFSCNYYPYPTEQYYTVSKGKIIKKKIFRPSSEVLGDVNRENIFKIWNNKNYQTLRFQFKNRQLKPPHSTCYFPYQIH
jgi:MoaA/NifB/PqqE/SkfB family radical SAM enzyme